MGTRTLGSRNGSISAEDVGASSRGRQRTTRAIWGKHNSRAAYLETEGITVKFDICCLDCFEPYQKCKQAVIFRSRHKS